MIWYKIVKEAGGFRAMITRKDGQKFTASPILESEKEVELWMADKTPPNNIDIEEYEIPISH